VRDVLQTADGGAVAMTVHPTIQEAVDAVLSARRSIIPSG
jgi:hypothetical protein